MSFAPFESFFLSVRRLSRSESFSSAELSPECDVPLWVFDWGGLSSETEDGRDELDVDA